MSDQQARAAEQRRRAVREPLDLRPEDHLQRAAELSAAPANRDEVAARRLGVQTELLWYLAKREQERTIR